MPEKWVAVCPRRNVTPAEMVAEEVDDREIVLVDVGGEVFAFDGICTHALGYLDQGELDGYEVLCPLHEGRFDVRTGAVVAGEPDEPIEVYPTKVEADTIYLLVPES
jgi:naphthalene 1,2-dioxygenase system ferredoxin subunit